jgi:hypothetical protein
MIFQNLDHAILCIQDGKLKFKNRALKKLLTEIDSPGDEENILQFKIFREADDLEGKGGDSYKNLFELIGVKGLKHKVF